MQIDNACEPMEQPHRRIRSRPDTLSGILNCVSQTPYRVANRGHTRFGTPSIRRICARTWCILVVVTDVRACQVSCLYFTCLQWPSKNDTGWSRTCNPQLRRPMPHPLGHGTLERNQHHIILRNSVIIGSLSQRLRGFQNSAR